MLAILFCMLGLRNKEEIKPSDNGNSLMKKSSGSSIGSLDSNVFSYSDANSWLKMTILGFIAHLTCSELCEFLFCFTALSCVAEEQSIYNYELFLLLGGI